MIRRYYIMPLRHAVSQPEIDELVHGMSVCDQFLEGITDSSAGVDFDSRTVIWENTLASEEMYTGPYMHHPYHAGTLDDYLMADSPLCWTQDTFTVRYRMDADQPRLDKGIRRLVLLKLEEGSSPAPLEALAARAPDMATSVLRADDIGWVSAKGRAWTHVWDQSFADVAALERYLGSPDGMQCSSGDGLKRLGLKLDAMRVYTYPFDLTGMRQAQPLPEEDGPAFYAMTARLDLADADTFVELLQGCYDPYVVACGGKLAHRFRTVEGGYPWTEVQSIWEIPSVAAYHDFRMGIGSNPGWLRFVNEAMPLVKGGTRRFWRAV